MSFDSVAPANAIMTILGTIPNIVAPQIGAPLSIGPMVSAYLTIGNIPSQIKTAGGTVQRDVHYFIDLAYRISDTVAQVTSAELNLMAALDIIQKAIYADKTLGGTCQEATIDTGLADTPEYRVRSGPEYREYPCVIICRQYDTYKATP